MYDILSYEEMTKLNVGETIRRNFLLCLLKMYEQAVQEYSEKKSEENTDLDIF